MAADNKEAPSPPRSRGKKKPFQKPAGPRVFPPVTVIIDSRHRDTDRTKELRPLASPNSYQKSLMEVAEPGTPCQVELGEGGLAPDIAQAAGDHPLRVTYNKLQFAPRLRIEYDLVKTGGIKYNVLVVELPFFRRSDRQLGLDDFQHCGDAISFTAHASNSSGFNNIDYSRHAHGTVDRQLIDKLKSLLVPNSSTKVTLRLRDELLASRELEKIKNIRDWLAAGNLEPRNSGSHCEYEAFGREPEFLYVPDDVVEANSRDILCMMPLPAQLKSAHSSQLLPSLDSGNTFAHVKEAAVELLFSAKTAEDEAQVALRLWAEVYHWLTLYDCGEYAVLAIKDFARFTTLDGGDSRKFKLPKELECDLPNHAAIFRITSRKLDFYGTRPFKPGDPAARASRVQFKPHSSCFVVKGQIETVRQLQKNDRWHPILLNQLHDEIAYVDTTARSRLDQSEQHRLFQLLRTCKAWDPEQLQVIDSITKVKGGMSITMGAAGTGKTLLSIALSLYFWCMGFHLLVVSPTNSDCNAIASQLTPELLQAEFPMWASETSDFDFLRLYPSSRDIGADKLTETQALRKGAGHERGQVLSFREFIIALEQRDKLKGTVKEYSVLQSMITAAESGHLATEAVSLKDQKLSDNWDILKSLIADYRGEQVEYKRLQNMMSDPRHVRRYGGLEEHSLVEEYADAYRACKAHIIRRNKFMISTISAVHASEFGHWCQETEGSAERAGVIVLVDEAAKDLEINIWAAIVNESWADMVAGVFLFGDDKQLTPTNTSMSGAVAYNPYSKRLDISLPFRLVQKGYPHIRLQEQRRMHGDLAAFPGRTIYDGRMRSGPAMSYDIDAVKPGFSQVLVDIISNGKQTARVLQDQNSLDGKLRLHWIEVRGKVVPQGKSIAVKAHVDVFFERMFAELRAYFQSRGEKMSEQLMLICAYRYAKQLYQEGFNALMRSDPSMTSDDMPRLETVDGSQGKQSFMVILDGTFQDGDRIGFMKDAARTNVAITRAKEVFWIIGGPLKCTEKRNEKHLIVQYKREMEDAGRCHRFN